MAQHLRDDPLFDYKIYRFGSGRHIFRGPQPDLRESYLCFLGATHTFGRFADAPFPSLVAAATGVRALNLGARGAGPGFFLNDPEVLHAASGAALCVVQAMCASAVSNRMFGVRPRRNIRLDTASDLLRGIYPDVDFDRFAFVRPMLRHLAALDTTRFRLVENEMKSAWVGRMQALLGAVATPTILLWFAQRAPEDDASGGDRAAAYPLFVDRAMIDAVRQAADGYAEIVTARGLPQKLRIDGRPVRSPSGEPIERNREFPSPEMHRDAAAALTPEIERLLARGAA